MDKEEIVILKNIDNTLSRLYEYLLKQPSKLEHLLNTVVAIVGILGVIGVVDVILKWFIS